MKFKHTIRIGHKQAFKGVWTFYVGSETQEGVEYTVKYIRRKRLQRKFICSCKAFLHQAGPLGKHCKHIKPLAALIREHGILKVADHVRRLERRYHQ